MADKNQPLNIVENFVDKPYTVQRLVERPVRPLLSAPPKATVHTETAAHDEAAAVIRYESSTPADTRIQVTYENNAVGTDQESKADKSDTVPDSRQL